MMESESEHHADGPKFRARSPCGVIAMYAYCRKTPPMIPAMIRRGIPNERRGRIR